MSDIKTTPSPSASPTLTDFAIRINTEFAAIQNADRDANKTVVQRAISFGRTLHQAKEKVGHGKWEKWLKDNCREISIRTAQRYMVLADSPEVRTEMGKNDTVSFLTLRKALALANQRQKDPTPPSDEYDRAENKLVEKLEALSPDTAEAAAHVTMERLNAAVTRIKTNPNKATRGGSIAQASALFLFLGPSIRRENHPRLLAGASIWWADVASGRVNG